MPFQYDEEYPTMFYSLLQVLEYLCRPGEDSHKEERQEALLELLSVGNEVNIDSHKLLLMAEHANL